MTVSKRWWLVSGVVTFLATFVTLYLWHERVTIYHPPTNQLHNQDQVTAFASAYSRGRTPVLVPTGLFIQSVRFDNFSDVNVTGYVWQKFPKSIPPRFERGVLFPEQVQSDDTIIEEQYRFETSDHEVIGWYFDVTVRQPFDYSLYPIDRLDVWLRLWPRDFEHDVLLVPDLVSYKTTKMGDLLGVDQSLVPGGWEINESYFSYRPVSYDCDFGIPEKTVANRESVPELHYSLILTRNFHNAFIIHLIPLLIVTSLLFAELVMTTDDNELSARFGGSTASAIATLSALFFVVVLAHIEVRKGFPGGQIVYLEHFYLATYVAILFTALNSYLFAKRTGPAVFRSRDNLIPKLAFWPLLTGYIVVVTLATF